MCKNKSYIKWICRLLICAVVIIMRADSVSAEQRLTYNSFCKTYGNYMQDGDLNGYYKYVKSIDGKRQKNGLKIYCALNGKTRTVKKTGKYAIIVGGTTVKKDNGKVKFIAPSSGNYKFTFNVRNNVARDTITITQKGNGNLINAKVDYSSPYTEIGHISKEKVLLLTAMPDSSAYYWNGKYDYFSNMRKISGTVYLKRGQYICFKGQYSYSIGIDEKLVEAAYNFVGYDLTITKLKK